MTSRVRGNLASALVIVSAAALQWLVAVRIPLELAPAQVQAHFVTECGEFQQVHVRPVGLTEP